MENSIITHFRKPFDGKLFPQNFGTVRLGNDNFYLGAEHKIVLNDELIGFAKIIAIRAFKFKDIRDVLSYLDGNCSTKTYAEKLKRDFNEHVEGGINESTEFVHAIFTWSRRIFSIHVRLLNEYYQKILDDDRWIDENQLPLKQFQYENS